MTPKAKRSVESVLAWIEKGYARLARLENELKDVLNDMEPIPQNGDLHTPADYGKALIGMGKFLIQIGEALMRLEESDE